MTSFPQLSNFRVSPRHRRGLSRFGYSPLAPKAEGWRSYVVDHTDRDGLVEKYRGAESVDPTKIESVDFVWTQGALSDAVPVEHHGSFDVFIASHVVEHIPD